MAFVLSGGGAVSGKAYWESDFRNFESGTSLIVEMIETGKKVGLEYIESTISRTH